MIFAAVALLIHMAGPAAPDLNAQPVVATAVKTEPLEAENHSSKPVAIPTTLGEAAAPALTTASLRATEHSSQPLSTVRVPAIEPAAPAKVIPAESMPSRRTWLILSIAQHSAAAFDAYSTRQAISRGARESDPLMRPFAQSPGIYAAIQGGPLVLDFAARKMQHSHNNFVRHSWWLPQSAATGLFLFSGAHNLSVPGRR